MKWIALVGFLSLSCSAMNPLVFMRENNSGKHIVLKENGQELAITTDSQWHLYPDISPDGKWITWVEGKDQSDLAVVLFNRETRSREKFVTKFRGQALQPRFSKNGAQIFFSAPTSTGSKIVSINPDELRASTPFRTVGDTRVYTITPTAVPHIGQGYFPRPSADGSFVVFQRNTGLTKEIVEYTFATKKFRVLAQGMAPAMSLDEKWIAYTSKDSGSWDIWMVDRRDGTKSQHTNDSKDEMAPAFMNDGSIAFASNRNERFQLFQAKGGEWVPLVESSSDDYAPNFAGDTSLKQTLLAPMLGPLRSSFGAIEAAGKIYVCGGHAGSEHTYPPESFVDNLQVYDPATNAWTELAPRPHKAHGYQLAAHGNYIYAFGGFAYDANYKPKWKSLDTIDRYDITTNTWTTVGQMPRARSSNVVAVVGSKAYLIGGWDATPKAPNDYEGTFHSAVDVFDMEKETIAEAPWSMPAPLRRAFNSSVRDGRIYLIGGLGQGATHFELLSNVTAINPETGFASEMTTLPFATFAPASGFLGNELLVFGGMFKTGEQDYEYVAHIYSHHLEKNSWGHSGRFMRETKGFSQVVELADSLIVLGGHHYIEDRDEPVATVEKFEKPFKK